jgi:hypothetical protein
MLVGLRESSVMHRANTKLRELSGAFPHAEPLAFFCECRNAACYAVVPLSAAAFDLLEAGRTCWLLVEGHEPSAPWPTYQADDPDASTTGVVVIGDWVPKSTGGGEAA